jgi:hypothetical protein
MLVTMTGSDINSALRFTPFIHPNLVVDLISRDSGQLRLLMRIFILGARAESSLAEKSGCS